MSKKIIKLTESDLRKIVQKVIFEQNQNLLSSLKSAVAGLGTDENALEVFFSKIKTLSDFNTINNQLKKTPIRADGERNGYSSLQEVLNGELGYGDSVTADRIKNLLSKIGVNLTFTKSGPIAKSFVITIPGSTMIDNKKVVEPVKPKAVGTVRVAPTEDAVKSGRAFVEVTMSGELVRKIQEVLIKNGFLKISKPTNYFGAKTDLAVRYFQKSKGLVVDGKVGNKTYRVLFSPEGIANIQPKGLKQIAISEPNLGPKKPITSPDNTIAASY